MAKQDVMERGFASDSEDNDEEEKEPEKKKSFFGKMFGSKGGGGDRDNGAYPSLSSIGSYKKKAAP